MVGLTWVRSINGGAAAALVTDSALLVRAPGAGGDAVMLPGACATATVEAVAVTTGTDVAGVELVSIGGRLFVCAAAAAFRLGTGGGCIAASVRVAGVMTPMSIIGMSSC